MAKLNGFISVAVIEQKGVDYHYAIFNDSFDYEAGDTVLVSNTSGWWKVKEVITVEEAAKRFNKNITAEVVCKVDPADYEKRIQNRKKAELLQKKMDEIVKNMDKSMKYDLYADKNPELKDILDEYKALVG